MTVFTVHSLFHQTYHGVIQHAQSVFVDGQPNLVLLDGGWQYWLLTGQTKKGLSLATTNHEVASLSPTLALKSLAPNSGHLRATVR